MLGFEELRAGGWVESKLRSLREGEQRCTRCSGAGGWSGWPGFTCHRCNGSGVDPQPIPKQQRSSEAIPPYNPELDYARVEYREQVGMASCLGCKRRDVASRVARGECVHCDPFEVEF